MNRETTEMIDFIDENIKDDLLSHLREKQIQPQATFNASILIKRFVYGVLLKNTENCYPIIHDYMTHCMGLVDWEKVGGYLLQQI